MKKVKWEYLEVEYSQGSSLKYWMDNLGEKGWELGSFTKDPNSIKEFIHCIFKRPIEEGGENK